MKPKISQETFIRRLRVARVGSNYDYSRVVYTGVHNDIEIGCPIHGWFWQNATTHLKGTNCPQCALTAKAAKRSFTTDQFISRSRASHGDRYDYSQAVYRGSQKKVRIICPTHGSFDQIAKEHMDGSGCQKCWFDAMANGALRNGRPRGGKPEARDVALKKFLFQHGPRYDYSRVVYVNNNTPIEIICPEHGIFEQLPLVHKRGSGCPACGRAIVEAGRRRTREDVVAELCKVHGNYYSYEAFVYISAKTTSIITCPSHGPFRCTPDQHRQGTGCPTCWSERRGLSGRGDPEEVLRRFKEQIGRAHV